MTWNKWLASMETENRHRCSLYSAPYGEGMTIEGGITTDNFDKGPRSGNPTNKQTAVPTGSSCMHACIYLVYEASWSL
jgi:hypothetical protein